MSGQTINEFSKVYKRGQWWRDELYPAISSARQNPAARIVIDVVEGGQGYAANARYPNEYIIFTCQVNHDHRSGSEVDPHIHWIQNQNATPNWLMEYRMYDNGAVAPAWPGTLLPWTTNAFVWGAGNLLQITEFADIPNTPTGVSWFMDVRLYRDSTNVSTLFAGADPYAGVALLKQWDLHISIDQPGSWAEYAKWG